MYNFDRSYVLNRYLGLFLTLANVSFFSLRQEPVHLLGFFYPECPSPCRGCYFMIFLTSVFKFKHRPTSHVNDTEFWHIWLTVVNDNDQSSVNKATQVSSDSPMSLSPVKRDLPLLLTPLMLLKTTLNTNHLLRNICHTVKKVSGIHVLSRDVTYYPGWGGEFAKLFLRCSPNDNGKTSLPSVSDNGEQFDLKFRDKVPW